jgi:hypothetical protein
MLPLLHSQSPLNDPLTTFHPEARSEIDVDAYLVSLGLAQTDRVLAGPGPHTSLDEFVRRITSGELSYIWRVPKPVQEPRRVARWRIRSSRRRDMAPGGSARGQRQGH